MMELKLKIQKKFLQLRLEEVNIWQDDLESVTCSFKKVAHPFKWCAYDCSWIYWQISSPWLVGFGTRWWLDALKGWWRPRSAFSCLWWWTCSLHTLSPVPWAGFWCKGHAFYALDDNCWPQAAMAQHLQENRNSSRKILVAVQNSTMFHFTKPAMLRLTRPVKFGWTLLEWK